MKTINQQYDTIFNTELITIGLRFDGAKLTRLAYLLNNPCKATVNIYAQRAQSSIEKYLQPKYLQPGSKAKLKISALKIDFQLNVSDFQKSVLDQLILIPFGETRTYGDIAKILDT